MSDYFAFDFDGVVCQSANESGITAWRAAHALWPDLVAAEPSADFIERFPGVRPVIETGHENVVVARLIVRGESDEAILRDFPAMRDDLMQSEGLDTQVVRGAFGTARDHWLNSDEDSWLDAQGFYPGVVEAINACPGARCIITTKEDRFTRKLIKRAGLRVDPDRVYALESFEGGGKRSVLARLRDEFPDAKLHFFEDRIKTLRGLEGSGLAHLYLVDWGYNTLAERETVAADDEIELIGMKRFEAVLGVA